MLRKAKRLVRKVVRTLRVAYYNFGGGPDQAKVEDLEEIWNAGAVLIGLSEHGDRDDVTDRFLRAHPRWDKFAGDGRPGAAKECILYDTELGKVTAKKTRTLVGARKLAPGAGPENAGPKCSNRIRMRVKVGRRWRRVHFIVGHQYATINKRKDAARLFIQALADMIRSLRGTVIFVGDLNATPGTAILHALKVLMPSWSTKTGPTHHKRLIDYIMVRGGQIIAAWSARGSSDHKMIFADVQIGS